MGKISTKLWAIMLLLIAVTLGLLWFFQIEFLEKYYVNSQIKIILNEGNKLSKLIETKATNQQFQEKVDELYVRYNARIDLYAPNGVLLYSSNYGQILSGADVDKNVILVDATSGNVVVKQYPHNKFSSNILVVGIPIGKKENLKGIILMSAPLAPVKETASILKQQLKIITAILIFISFFITYFFSKMFTRPIRKINDAASRMAAGNLSVKVDVKSKDELGMLSDTINNLSVQLQKIEQLRKELIANVSHEFRTPLSLVKGYAEMIRDITGDNIDKRTKQTNIIIEEADRLKNMIDDILSLSQIQSQYFQMNEGIFDIIGTIQSVKNRFTYLQESTGTSLTLECDSVSVLVHGDEMRIEQVLYNLINNAYNHTEKGGTIQINVKASNDKALIEVRDNGSGIPQEELPYIWDRFYKASGEKKKEQQGTGLGLAIVKSILEAHKSSFGVQSELGVGSVFWFELNRDNA